MDFVIRPFRPNDIEAIIDLSLLAWEPVFTSFRSVLGEKIYTLIYPDWRKTQREGVKTYVEDVEKVTTLVGEVGGKVVGFLAYVIHEADKTENSGKVGSDKIANVWEE